MVTHRRTIRSADPNNKNVNQLQGASHYSYFISLNKFLMSLQDFKNSFLRYPALPMGDLL